MQVDVQQQALHTRRGALLANCLVLLNDGSSNVLLNDGSSKVLLNDDSCGVAPTPSAGGGGGSGVGRSKQVGVSVYDRDPSIPPKRKLTPMWDFEIKAGVMLPQVKTFELLSKFKLESKKKFSVSVEKFAIAEKVLGVRARFKTKTNKEFWLSSKFAKKESLGYIEAKFDPKKIIKLLETYLKVFESNIKTFDFEEQHDAWRELTKNERDTTAFTHSSSWIGRVIYDSDTQQMSITMSGKQYLFCGVDDRTFDSFEGSPSKGEFYWRILKDRFTC